MTDTVRRPVADPVVVRRQNELFDLYNQWPGDDDPDDDPDFVAAARKVMGLPPLDESSPHIWSNNHAQAAADTASSRWYGGEYGDLLLALDRAFESYEQAEVGGIRLFDPKQLRDPQSGKWIGNGTLNPSGLTDGDLLDRFAEISRSAEPDEDALRAIDAELEKRETRHREMAAALDSASDSKLTERFGDLSDDSEVLRRIDELVAGGRDYRSAYAEAYNIDPAELTKQELASILDAQKGPGETREHVVRRLYDEVTHLTYLRAEDWTRGNLLSQAGRSAGVSALSLFSGPRARARKYASEELKLFWAEVEARQTYTEFKATMTGRDRDKQAAAIIKGQGQDKDFGL